MIFSKWVQLGKNNTLIITGVCKSLWCTFQWLNFSKLVIKKYENFLKVQSYVNVSNSILFCGKKSSLIGEMSCSFLGTPKTVCYRKPSLIAFILWSLWETGPVCSWFLLLYTFSSHLTFPDNYHIDDQQYTTNTAFLTKKCGICPQQFFPVTFLYCYALCNPSNILPVLHLHVWCFFDFYKIGDTQCWTARECTMESLVFCLAKSSGG